jgi:hypothetical protein
MPDNDVAVLAGGYRPALAPDRGILIASPAAGGNRGR